MDYSTRPTSEQRAEAALHEHYQRELAGVQGKARATFLAAIEQETATRTRRSGAGRRLFIGTLMAAAAALAFGFGLWSVRTVSPERPLAATAPAPEVSGADAPETTGRADSAFRTLAYDPADLRPVTPVTRQQWWQTQDAGTYVVDGEPVRAVQRREWETTTFRNAAGFQVTIERPREQWMLVDADVQ